MNIKSKSSLILAVDVGNTTSAIALIKNGKVKKTISFLTADSTQEKIIKILDKVYYKKLKIDGSIISSVVPAVNELWLKVLKNSVFITHKLELGFKNKYPSMHKLGADRIANISAAVLKYKAPMVVVDIGTAVTFDVINAKAEFIGGVIAPGPKLFLDYMHEKTAKLPKIKINTIKQSNPAVAGNTANAMKSAFLYGYPSMLEGILTSIEKQIANPRIIATGGWASKKLFIRTDVIYDKFLIFDGLYRLWILNS